MLHKLKINDTGDDYLLERLKEGKKGIIISIILSITLPFLFLTLKTNFYQKEIDGLLISACITGFLLALIMVKKSITRLAELKKFTKMVEIDNNSIIIYTYDGGIFKSEADKFYIAPEHKKDVFGKRLSFDWEVFALQNFNEGKKFYLIKDFFPQWDDLKTIIKGEFEEEQPISTP